MITRDMFFERASGTPLWMRSKLIQFDLSPDQTIVINGAMQDFSIRYTIVGNTIAEQMSEVMQQNLPLLEKETLLALQIDSLEYHHADTELIDSLNQEFDKTREEYTARRLAYAIKNPNHELSASFLSMQAKDTILKYFPTLGTAALATFYGKELKNRVRIYEQTEKGKLAPNIVDAGTFNLSDLRGKIVVLEFWGTWCGACVKGLPKMREYYNRYNPKVEFVSIACHDEKAKWERFVKAEGLQWTQLWNNASENDLTKQYRIEAFPTKIIIDKEGKIVETFTGETGAFYQELDLLMTH